MNEFTEVGNEVPANRGNGLNLVAISLSDKLYDNSQPSIASDFGRSFAHTLVQAPLEGVAQLIDGKANGDTQKAVHFLDGPEHASFGTSHWAAQQAGSALGAIIPVLAIHKGVSSTLGRNYSTKAALAMSENMQALTTRQAFGAGGVKMAESALTGAIYSGVFTPVRNDETDFWAARARNSTVGGMTFATLTGSGLGLKAIAESSTAARMPAMATALRSEVTSGILSGIPAGLVAANGDSLLSGKGFATGEQSLQSMLTFSIMGGGFAYGKGKIAELRPSARTTESTGQFKEAGVDVDGRPIAESGRAKVAANLPEYSSAEMGRARGQTLRDLAEIKALEPGKSVLDQFRDSGLSIGQKYRVLNSLAEVREHFVNQRNDGKIDADQNGNWIHTQGELGRVMDASRAGKLSPIQTEDALLSSMFADAVKSKANFFTHHIDGALAADHVLSKQLGGGFNRARLDGVVHGIREHQIGPPEFMAMLYGNRIKGALKFQLTPEQEGALGSLQKKIADPLNPANETYRTADGGTALKLTPQETALLELTGNKEWYVPKESNVWNRSSRAVIDGDTMDNYYTPGGIGKITGLGGPESDKFFMTRRLDAGAGVVDRTTNIGSARASGVDAGKLLTPESKPLAEAGLAQTEAAIAMAKQKAVESLQKSNGLDPSKEVPFLNTDLVYPKFGEADAQWWNIHRTAPGARSAADQAFYDAHRFDGLSAAEQTAFLNAKILRDQTVANLRAAQRLDGQQPPEYRPSTGR
ncbi:MAG: hypothetical protein K2W95_18980 [Candidatus Obscuribacterales bacterium]|nr:hypothetical protein [Candidatus Obscuribacterales bacterium]